MFKKPYLVTICMILIVISSSTLATENTTVVTPFLKEIWKKLGENEASLAALALIVSVLWGVWKLLKRRSQVSSEPENLKPVIQASSHSIEELDDCYYSELHQRCDRYDLGSFRDSQAVSEYTSAHVNLSDIYVDLMAHPVDKPIEEDDGNNRLENLKAEASLLLLELLQEKTLNRMVLRGDVGSGKSSFINYLTYSIVASRNGKSVLPAVPEHWLRRPVVRLLLREVGGQIKQENPEAQLISFVRQRVQEHISQRLNVDELTLDDWWNVFWAKFQENGVLILDGLDEVSGSHEQPEAASRRQILLKAVNQFSQNSNHQQLSVIITSRNHAYGGDDALPHFKLFQLDPLNNSDRYAVFIQHWYKKVAFDAAQRSSAKKDARELINNIAKNASLVALTETPLLLTLILVLDKAEIGLPDSRAELYENAVNLLLDRWTKQLLNYSESLSAEEQNGIQVLKQDVGILREALKDLAFKTYQSEARTTKQGEAADDQDRGIVFSVEVVNEALKDQLQQHQGLGFTHQDACRDFLRFRCQILVAVGDQLSFVHKSFHEYLAAAYIMDDSFNREDRLLEMAASFEQRDWWQKVFLFALNTENALFVMKLLKAGVLSKQLVAMTDEADIANHLDTLSLFSRAALENKLESEVSKKGVKNANLLGAYKDLQVHIDLLWQRDDLTVHQRAQLGRIAGRCGDMRRGVTFKRNEQYVVEYHRTETTAFPIPEFDWKEVSAGEFMMGTEGEEGYADEKPPQLIKFEQPFHMASSAVTNAQYQSFIDAGGYTDESIWKALPDPAYQWWQGESPGLSLIDSYPEDHRESLRQFYLNDKERKQPRYWQNNRWNISNHPVIGVSWFEVLAYIEWLNRNKELVLPKALLDQNVRICLPSEDQWEYAARGVENLTYAWGSEEDSSKGNNEETKLKRTNTVGVFDKGQAFGLYDMSGNVWEWTASRWGQDVMSCDFNYGDDYLERKLVQNDPNPIEFRVTRGGSWLSTTGSCRCAIRDRNLPDLRDYNLGFRLVCM